MALHVGPSGADLAPNTFEAFVKVPNILRPHTQIFCTRYTSYSFAPPKKFCFIKISYLVISYISSGT